MKLNSSLTVIGLAFLFLSLTAFSCGGGGSSDPATALPAGGGGGGGGANPGPMVGVEIRKLGGTQSADDPMLIPKGPRNTNESNFQLMVVGYDAQSNNISMETGHVITWSFADNAIADFANTQINGDSTNYIIQVQSLKDYFDNGSIAEPSTTLTVTVDNAFSDYITVVGIVNLDGIRYKGIGDITTDATISQTGRNFSWSSGRSGYIQNDQFFFGVNTVYSATIAPDFNNLTNGTSTANPPDNWSAVKMN